MKFLRFISILLTAFVLVPLAPARASSQKEMRIHVIYHGNGLSATDAYAGDAVLIESKGKYLLMDTGTKASALKYVIPYIHRIADVSGWPPSPVPFSMPSGGGDHQVALVSPSPPKLISVDVYISHYHGDHYGGLNEILKDNRIIVNKVYLPGIKEVRSVVNSAGKTVTHVKQVERENTVVGWVTKRMGKNPVHLNTGSKIAIGDAKLKVIGPVGKHLKNYRRLVSETRRLGTPIPHEVKDNGVYTNNYSLVSMITCGKTKYLTAGDIEGKAGRIKNAVKREEDYLVDKYGKKLKADILKLSHHGIYPSNSSTFLKKVNPTYMFITNDVTNHLSIQNTWDRATDRGLCYMMGTERRGLIFDVRNNNISLYRGNLSPASRMQGYTRLRGLLPRLR
ncbi:MAG: MBL fold metallo-hydrolase [Oscillospiraceae bacterium]|nr:MBL fold metallo-hydrolase [Oscillospiraceae bacterium]